MSPCVNGCQHGMQGEELVIDEDEAAIEAEPPRQLAPLPEPPAAPGLLLSQPLTGCMQPY